MLFFYSLNNVHYIFNTLQYWQSILEFHLSNARNEKNLQQYGLIESRKLDTIN